MSLQPPQRLASRLAEQTPQTALDYEIAQEMASALGRLGRDLEATLAALAAFDAEPTDLPAADRRSARIALVRTAAQALWHFVVQRESIGLRDTVRVLRDYRVPNEVRDRMGAFPAR
jgi:hypothetical protein